MSVSNRLWGCMLMAACGGAQAGRAPPEPGLCSSSAPGEGAPETLLSMACDGGVRPGRAGFSIEGRSVVLAFPPGAPGPRGAEVVEAWPPLDAPPWLGHDLVGIVVLPGGGIRVEFRNPVSDEARIFTDPRMAGPGVRTIYDRDVRDSIDRGTSVVTTRHEPSVAYALSMGRAVERIGFDQRYYLVFLDSVSLPSARRLSDSLASGWVERGAPGARRPPSPEGSVAGVRCHETAPLAGAGQGSEGPPTVSYPRGDGPALEIAQRLVSAALREPSGTGLLRSRASSARLTLRAAGPVDPPGSSDVASVVRVQVGNTHPCSTWGEVRWAVFRQTGRSWTDDATAFAIGEVAAFVVAPVRGLP